MGFVAVVAIGVSLLRFLVIPFHLVVAVLILKRNEYRLYRKKLIRGGYSKIIAGILITGGVLGIIGIFVPYVFYGIFLSLLIAIVLGFLDPQGKERFKINPSAGASEFKVRPLEPDNGKIREVRPNQPVELDLDLKTDPEPQVLEQELVRKIQPAQPLKRDLPVTLSREEAVQNNVNQKAPAQLIVVQSKVQLPRMIPIKTHDFSIGRAEGNDLQILDVSVSRVHARIRHANGAWFIQDQGSKGSILLNGKKIKASRLNHKDTIQIGNTKFSFIQNLS